jgi:hypothetical protein
MPLHLLLAVSVNKDMIRGERKSHSHSFYVSAYSDSIQFNSLF